MTLIDSSYIGSCAQCGAAMMPENQVTHSEWHRHVARVTQAVIELQEAATVFAIEGRKRSL